MKQQLLAAVGMIVSCSKHEGSVAQLEKKVKRWAKQQQSLLRKILKKMLSRAEKNTWFYIL
jgi:hypothetical protein